MFELVCEKFPRHRGCFVCFIVGADDERQCCAAVLPNALFSDGGPGGASAGGTVRP